MEALKAFRPIKYTTLSRTLGTTVEAVKRKIRCLAKNVQQEVEAGPVLHRGSETGAGVGNLQQQPLHVPTAGGIQVVVKPEPPSPPRHVPGFPSQPGAGAALGLSIPAGTSSHSGVGGPSLASSTIPLPKLQQASEPILKAQRKKRVVKDQETKDREAREKAAKAEEKEEKAYLKEQVRC